MKGFDEGRKFPKSFKDEFGNVYILSFNRWKHIATEHPEVQDSMNKIEFVLSNPDLVKKSKRAKDVWLYYKFDQSIFGGKYLLVVTKKGVPGIIVTFYITDKIKRGEEIWRKS